MTEDASIKKSVGGEYTQRTYMQHLIPEKN